ncbi:P-loop containing nucleoside triphosphate hydrolase protein [Mycena sp. CBHHK59/15]|nr:P-loop containing nucleoside triphosphate hydrolase protein [Mycena sp. CBHHK59/15]KAJ6601549.1 P-loop containing nucleoside triphosphate hydrolase protein [Mycena sp. CBHHK59/15]
MGLSSGIFAAVALLSQAYLGSSIKLLILGSVVETARRVCQWLIERFRIQYSVTAKFDEGDPAYEWILLFLTQENVWRRSRKFTVTATNSRRKWAVNKWMDPTVKGSAEYVPSYQKPQLFRWRGHWIDIQRSNDSGPASFMPTGVYMQTATIYLTIYTLDMNVLSELVEEAHGRYVEINRPNVVIHLADSLHFGAGMTWNNVKHKVHRPLSSIILQEGVVDALVRDAQEFISTEDWYVEAGIPHRRGYLLYGPPGTGKTSTIYALAGALNLEIYSLSLASGCVDDSSLQRVASAIPKHALFLIEDIDCAFARDDEDDDECGVFGMATQVRADGMMKPVGSKVTLSGLLNVIDGVGSEEGKIFFATVRPFPSS